MRGWYGFGPALAVGLAWNLWCHRTGRPTVCSDTRHVPAGLVCAALAAGGAVLVDHLYGQGAHHAAAR